MCTSNYSSNKNQYAAHPARCNPERGYSLYHGTDYDFNIKIIIWSDDSCDSYSTINVILPSDRKEMAMKSSEVEMRAWKSLETPLNSLSFLYHSLFLSRSGQSTSA